MKTKILPVIALLVLMSGVSKSSYAVTIHNTDCTVLNGIKAITRIEVRGNVELFISDNATENVKVYNQYYSESAVLQYNSGVLRIASYNDKKLVVWVTANDLRSVSAYDNAEVRSFGGFSNIEFSVELHNYASAKLNLNVYSANITLRDHAKAELSGTATEFNLDRNVGSTLIDSDFLANQKISTPAKAKNADIAGLE